MNKRLLLSVFLAFLLIAQSIPAFAEEYSIPDPYTIRVAGVTFKNNDGTDRQTILRHAYETGSTHSGSLIPYIYEGDPAIYVQIGSKIIGNIPAEEVMPVLHNLNKIKSVSVNVGDFYGDDGRLLYYAKVTISKSESFVPSANSNISPYLVAAFLVVSALLIILCLRVKQIPLMNKKYDLPIFWHFFVYYAPMIVLLYFFIDLFNPDHNLHFIWIISIVCFFSLFARIVHPLVYDIPLTVLYIIAFIQELQLDLHNRLGVWLIVSSILFFIYLFRCSIPLYFPSRR